MMSYDEYDRIDDFDETNHESEDAERLSLISKEGSKAFREGKSLSDNPYGKFGVYDEYNTWIVGFEFAKESAVNGIVP